MEIQSNVVAGEPLCEVARQAHIVTPRIDGTSEDIDNAFAGIIHVVG